MIPQPKTCDIFCRVVDNYGDIGVCWRLARQLAGEHAIAVRLVVDDLSAFSRIAPAVNADLTMQLIGGVEVLVWNDAIDALPPADWVIEAFACELPTGYLNHMAERAEPPQWINLEYLSAESWVVEHHLLPSPHPQLRLTKHFFFPGFTPATGGLIRERSIVAKPLHADNATPESALRIFIFAYENAPVDGLMRALSADGAQEGPSAQVTLAGENWKAKLKHWCGFRAENASKSAPVLEFHFSIFVPQTDFDAVLNAHDVLFVRGEDSFVRAQWAAKPFIWQIYPQADGAHWVKLNAFLDLYCAGLAPEAASALRELWRVWNAADGVELPLAWQRFTQQRSALRQHAMGWANQLMQMPDLASNLLSFYKKNAKI